jgi:hypothetical protein
MDRRRRLLRAALALFVGVTASVREPVAPRRAAAAWIESLVMPGEVIAGHARVEGECERCHTPFDKAAQDRLCRTCHDEVGDDLAARRGFHGRAPAVAGAPCKTCHGEHRGRDADVVRFDRLTFDHQLTDLALRDRHTTVACAGCHAQGQRYRDAASECSTCHGGADPHAGSLGLACTDCHAESAWVPARFDHQTSTFPLEGRHLDVRCEDCHPSPRYRPTAHTCRACHAGDDAHEGRLGHACESCHTAQSWPATAFDHARDTDFPLLGQHARTTCESCHALGESPDGAPTTCRGCHERHDTHQGNFGPRCETCHHPDGWERHTFEHHRRTAFPLRGRHGELRCTQCHPGNLGEHLDTACHACHRDDDVHRGQQGADCNACHDERGWRAEVLFDHDLAAFPLLGAHAHVPCAQCHPSQAFKGVARACASCHAEADRHRGRLGNDCGDCHNPTAWKAWDFDHGRRTSFALEGRHTHTRCEACHREPIADRIRLSRRCASCHAGDDVHRGQFGASCERCHEAADFRLIHYGE